METAKIEATISEQGLRTEIMGQGRDVVSCIAAVMNTFAEGIARDEKYECDIEEAMAHVATLTIRRMLELRAGGNSIHIDVETIRKMTKVFDWHSQDCRASGPLDVAHTVTQQYGTGGGNTPMIDCDCVRMRLV